MAADNFAMIAGNLGSDPDLSYTDSGAAVSNFSVAVSNSYKKPDGTKVDNPPSWFDVTAWREMAENVAESFRQGDRVVVVGRLQQDKWEADGQKRSKVKIVADSVAADARWASVTVERAQRREAS